MLLKATSMSKKAMSKKAGPLYCLDNKTIVLCIMSSISKKAISAYSLLLNALSAIIAILFRLNHVSVDRSLLLACCKPEISFGFMVRWRLKSLSIVLRTRDQGRRVSLPWLYKTTFVRSHTFGTMPVVRTMQKIFFIHCPKLAPAIGS